MHIHIFQTSIHIVFKEPSFDKGRKLPPCKVAMVPSPAASPAKEAVTQSFGPWMEGCHEPADSYSDRVGPEIEITSMEHQHVY